MAARTAERRPMGAFGRMSLVAAAHAALLFGIAGGLGIVPALKVDPIVARFYDPPKPPPPEDPRVREPQIKQPDQILLPKPEPLPVPPDASDDTITGELVPVQQIPQGAGSAVVEPQIFSARPDPRRPLSQPPYPAELIRKNVQGAVDVEVFVQPDGRVGDARIVTSSGYEAFDLSTLDEAKRKWRLVPATRDGVAIPQWYRLRVVFKLKDQ
jgi:periplasmic protein TonB